MFGTKVVCGFTQDRVGSRRCSSEGPPSTSKLKSLAGEAEADCEEACDEGLLQQATRYTSRLRSRSAGSFKGQKWTRPRPGYACLVHRVMREAQIRKAYPITIPLDPKAITSWWQAFLRQMRLPRHGIIKAGSLRLREVSVPLGRTAPLNLKVART